MAAVLIECLLGRVGSPDEEVEVNTSKAGPNSSRWIINVRHDAKDVQAFTINLLDHRARTKKKNGCISHSITPLDAGAAAARLRIPQPDLPDIRIELDRGDGVVNYRIAIDAVHSLMR